MTLRSVERIEVDGDLCAVLIPAAHRPTETTFYTRHDSSFQVGQIVYQAGGEVMPHRHRPIQRRLAGTSEAIVVQAGACELALYDSRNREVQTRVLGPGDVVLLLGGGHAFRMQADTVLLEVKQGPYTGEDEKERFEP